MQPPAVVTGAAAAVQAATAAPLSLEPQPPAPHPLAPWEAGAAANVPPCLVCCSEMALVSLGSCDHKAVCGRCCLRLRLCYGDARCPLCKAELTEAVVAPWAAAPSRFADRRAFRSPAFAAGGVSACSGGDARDDAMLLDALRRSAAVACSTCDPGAYRPFKRLEHLEAHMRTAHRRRLCGLCLKEGRQFPLELPAYHDDKAANAHLAKAHPECRFCRRRFYDDDALFSHMQQEHFRCTVCDPDRGTHAYFANGTDLQVRRVTFVFLFGFRV
jgi:E3 ubiquitin-protein ligase ZNF598